MTIVASVYVRLDSTVSFILKALRTLHHGVWLGLLDGNRLAQVGQLQYGRWLRYREPEHNLGGFFDWEETAVSRWFPASGKVVIGAVGGGREAVAFARRGFKVTAFECHPELAADAQALLQSQGLPGSVTHTPANAVYGPDAPYDALVLGWGAYIHIPGRIGRIDLLRQFRNLAGAESPFLLSFFCRPKDSRRFLWVYRIARSIRWLKRSNEPLELGDLMDGTFDHYFTEEEIRSELAEAGFRILYFTEKPFGHAIALPASDGYEPIDSL